MNSIFPAGKALSGLANADIGLMKAKNALQQTTLGQKKLEEIDAAAKDFESMFVTEMLQPMFETVGTDAFFGGGEGEDTWKGMMIEQYSKEIGKAGGLGLSDAIKASMIQMQETADKAAQTGNEGA